VRLHDSSGEQQQQIVIVMKITTLAVGVQAQNASSVTFKYRVTARLNATDESAIKWGLWAKIVVFGEEKFGNSYLPFMKSTEGWAGDPQIPTGKKQGDSWTVEFSESYQKNVIAMKGQENAIVVTARLVPVSEFNPSPTLTHTFTAQI